MECFCHISIFCSWTAFLSIHCVLVLSIQSINPSPYAFDKQIHKICILYYWHNNRCIWEYAADKNKMTSWTKIMGAKLVPSSLSFVCFTDAYVVHVPVFVHFMEIFLALLYHFLEHIQRKSMFCCGTCLLPRHEYSMRSFLKNSVARYWYSVTYLVSWLHVDCR